MIFSVSSVMQKECPSCLLGVVVFDAASHTVQYMPLGILLIPCDVFRETRQHEIVSEAHFICGSRFDTPRGIYVLNSADVTSFR